MQQLLILQQAPVQYVMQHFTFQISAYYGGSAGLTKREALIVFSKFRACLYPQGFGEVNVQYRNDRLTAKVLFAAISIPEADKINQSLCQQQLPNYPLVLCRSCLSHSKKLKTDAFIRYENFDLNSSIPKNGIKTKY